LLRHLPSPTHPPTPPTPPPPGATPATLPYSVMLLVLCAPLHLHTQVQIPCLRFASPMIFPFFHSASAVHQLYTCKNSMCEPPASLPPPPPPPGCAHGVCLCVRAAQFNNMTVIPSVISMSYTWYVDLLKLLQHRLHRAVTARHTPCCLCWSAHSLLPVLECTRGNDRLLPPGVPRVVAESAQ
jgi:hypothetical protein